MYGGMSAGTASAIRTDRLAAQEAHEPAQHPTARRSRVATDLPCRRRALSCCTAIHGGAHRGAGAGSSGIAAQQVDEQIGKWHDAAMTNTATAAPMIHVRLDRRRHIVRVVKYKVSTSEPQNRGQPGGHLVDATRRLRVIECHGLEGVDAPECSSDPARRRAAESAPPRTARAAARLRGEQVVDELLRFPGMRCSAMSETTSGMTGTPKPFGRAAPWLSAAHLERDFTSSVSVRPTLTSPRETDRARRSCCRQVHGIRCSRRKKSSIFASPS